MCIIRVCVVAGLVRLLVLWIYTLVNLEDGGQMDGS